MTIYNTGKWYVWSGSESPVDPHSEVEVVGGYDAPWVGLASKPYWRNVAAFRVTKPALKTPREWWGVDGSFTFWPDEKSAREATGAEPFCVREVL